MPDIVQSFNALTPEQWSLAGGKGASLARLHQAGYPVPDGFVILPAAFEGEELAPEAWTPVQAHLARLRGARPGLALAVRSSALSEDSAQASFAGEFETVLNVRTDEEVRQAIHTVRQSRHSARVQAYSQAHAMPTIHEIAVVVQVLAPAQVSGVLFTAHPLTGRRDQALITANWGLGEALVGGLVTPDTLTLDVTTGRVLTRETADKQVMTVGVASGTRAQPVPERMRRAPALSDAQAAVLARVGAQIATLYGMPMDIEWVLADGQLSIVQARPITALPAPEPPSPTRWKLPHGVYAAMRNNIVELMAAPLTPLFDTLGRAAINASLQRITGAFFGRPGVMPAEIIISVNGYAYNNGSLRPAALLYVLVDSLGIARRMFTGAVERWTQAGRPRYLETVARWQAEPWRDYPSARLLGAARSLAEAAIDAYSALVSGVIPAAWITEALFTLLYNRLLRRRGDPPAPAYLLGFDSTPLQAGKSLYDLAAWARSRAGLAAYLLDTPLQQIVAQTAGDPPAPGVDATDWRAWQGGFQAYLRRFGHTIYNLDFSNPVPADDPAPALETCRMFIRGLGADPYARQQASIQAREQATQAMLPRLKGLRLKLFSRFLARAQRYAPLREDGLADVGLGYPLLRQMLLELGRRFVAAGVLAQPPSIFWLTEEEVEGAAACLDRGETPGALDEVIPQRQAAWRAASRVTPPLRLPHLALSGRGPTTRTPASGRNPNQIRGIPASPGRVTAPACVLHGPEDFAQMQTGGVLVAAITTPAWTPLFARASAVVTDVGGPLSHGSIVAREYGIPAVLGTDVATKRIRSGQVITVDGDAGTVTL